MRCLSLRVPKTQSNHLDGKSHLRPLHGAQAAGSTTAPRCGRRGVAAWPACPDVERRKVRPLALSAFPPPPPNPTRCGALTDNVTARGRSLILPAGRTGKCPGGRKHLFPCYGPRLSQSRQDLLVLGQMISASGAVPNHHRVCPSESSCPRRRCGIANSSGERHGNRPQ